MSQQKTENPRHKALAEMNEAHAKSIAAELSPIEGAPAVEFEPAPTEEPIKAEGSDSPAEPVKAKEEPEAGSPEVKEEPKEPVRAEDGKFAPKPKEMVTVKIDGETMQVSKEEIDAVGSVNLYQIEKTSAKRLQKQNQLNSETLALNQELRNLVEKQKQPATPQPNQDEAALARANALIYGDDAQKAQAMREMTQPATIPMDQIEYRVMKKMELETAEKAFVERAKDILYGEDGNIRPLVLEAATARSNRLRQAIAQTGRFPDNPDQFYKDLESELRRDMGKPAVVADLSARIEKKKEIAEPKTAAGRVPAPVETKPPTTAQIIDQQRKARGQKALYG